MRDDLRELVRFAWHGGAVRPLILLCMLLGGVVSVLESYWPVVLKTLVPMHGAPGVRPVPHADAGRQGRGRLGVVSRDEALRRTAGARRVAAVRRRREPRADALGESRGRVRRRAERVALFLGIAGAVVNAVLHHRTPDALRSRAVSFFSLVFQLGSMIASILLGYLVSQWGVQAVWCGVGVLVAAAAGYGVDRRLGRRPDGGGEDDGARVGRAHRFDACVMRHAEAAVLLFVTPR